MNPYRKWLANVFLLAFAAYWASNLILWYPWTYSSTLGITLMLTVTPLLWAYVTFLALRTYPKQKLFRGALIISLVLLVVAVIFDYVFFGLIRDAMEELYHPTTFYGYGFLIFWPLVLYLIFRKKLANNRSKIENEQLRNTMIVGLTCFLALCLIILFE